LSTFSLKKYLEQSRREVDAALRQLFGTLKASPPTLRKAMAYSVFAGGKRLRPVLCLASAQIVGLERPSALRLACSLELIHTYSLIHDDLPALDNDDFRRGRPTNHKAFGEAMAVLAGDGLLTLAFEWLSNPSAYPAGRRSRLPEVIWDLARSAGWSGMVGGQVDDVLAEGGKPFLRRVGSIHRRKTGALLAAALRLPALLAGASLRTRRALESYGRDAGLAFQIVDDVLNETGDARQLGKAVGSDKSRGKMTYPAACGLEASRLEITRLTGRAIASLKFLGPKAYPLKALAEHMANRTL
jgi:geranylgeranyl diphosphate synthase type II